MMKMRIAAVLAAVMIGTAALPAVTVFAQGNDPEQTTAAETAAAPETSAVTETAETDAKDDSDNVSYIPGFQSVHNPKNEVQIKLII